MIDFGIVGGGIGGSLSSLFLSQDYNCTLFEKEPYLGGCSSTFRRGKHFFNSGATTFAGYSKGLSLYEYLNNYNINFNKKKLDSVATVLQDDKKIIRYNNLEKFIGSLNQAYPNQKHKEFFSLVYQINKRFYEINDYVYSNYSFLEKVKSLYSFKNLLKEFYPYVLINGEEYLRKFYKNDIDEKYIDFVDNQVLIVSQARSKEINALTMILALGYQFLDNYYIYGGMGSVFEAIESKLENVEKRCFIDKIYREKDYFVLKNKRNKIFKCTNLVLNSTIFDSLEIIEDEKINKYLSSFDKLKSTNSAFVVYMKLDTKKEFDEHYQIIVDNKFSHSISNSIFISFSRNDDDKLRGSVTISTHTSTLFWENDIEKKRKELQMQIVDVVKNKLEIEDSEIKDIFNATPKTFKKFINRESLGGNPITMKNNIYNLPSNNTPINNFYLVGDTSYAAQGWPGVMMGVENLKRLVCKKNQ